MDHRATATARSPRNPSTSPLQASVARLRSALLAGGAEEPEISSIQSKLQIVAVRAYAGDPATHVERPPLLQCGEEHVTPSFRFCEGANVPNLRSSLLTDLFRHSRVLSLGIAQPSCTRLDQDRSVFGQSRL